MGSTHNRIHGHVIVAQVEVVRRTSPRIIKSGISTIFLTKLQMFKLQKGVHFQQIFNLIIWRIISQLFSLRHINKPTSPYIGNPVISWILLVQFLITVNGFLITQNFHVISLFKFVFYAKVNGFVRNVFARGILPFVLWRTVFIAWFDRRAEYWVALFDLWVDCHLVNWLFTIKNIWAHWWLIPLKMTLKARFHNLISTLGQRSDRCLFCWMVSLDNTFRFLGESPILSIPFLHYRVVF